MTVQNCQNQPRKHLSIPLTERCSRLFWSATSVEGISLLLFVVSPMSVAAVQSSIGDKRKRRNMKSSIGCQHTQGHSAIQNKARQSQRVLITVRTAWLCGDGPGCSVQCTTGMELHKTNMDSISPSLFWSF